MRIFRYMVVKKVLHGSTRNHNTSLVPSGSSCIASLQARVTNSTRKFPTRSSNSNAACIWASGHCQKRVTCQKHHVWQALECCVSSHSVKACCNIINVDNISDKQRILSLAAANSCIMQYAEDYFNFCCIVICGLWNFAWGGFWFQWSISQSPNEIKWVWLA